MDLVTAWPAGKVEKEGVISHSKTGMRELSQMLRLSNANRPELSHREDHADERSMPLQITDVDLEPDQPIRSIRFDMHLSNDKSDKTHIYTSVQPKQGSSPRKLDDLPNWQTMFPELAHRYDQGRIDCPLYLFESGLRLVDQLRLGQTTLGIEFIIDFGNASLFDDWRSCTKIHKQGFTRQDFEDTEFEKNPWDKLDYVGNTNENRKSDIHLVVPFKSRWWVKLFSSIMSKSVEARKSKGREALRWAQDYASAYLRELSIMQDIWATPRCAYDQRRPQRMATLLWTFNQARNGEAATTTWRPLTIPGTSPFQVQEPDPSAMAPLMDLEATMRATADMRPQHYESYCGRSHRDHLFDTTSDMLTCQTSTCETEVNTPMLDYQSFPSATSASFPSSVSSSTYPPYHGSSFDSQDSYYHPMDSSFSAHPKSQGLLIRDSDVLRSQPPSTYDSQDLIYESNPSSATGTLSSYTPFKHDQNDDIADVTPHEHMTVGSGPLPYILSSDEGMSSLPHPQSDLYEAPLLAPRASIIPQQQLEQQLESFERWVPLPGSDELHSHQDYIPDEVNTQGTDAALASPNSTRQQPSDQQPQPNARPGGTTEDDYITDFESCQQQQLEYLDEAAQYWQQSFQGAPCATGLNLLADDHNPPDTSNHTDNDGT